MIIIIYFCCFTKSNVFFIVALADPSISLVTLTGRAGSGKTLLALAAALHQVFVEQRFDNVLVTRPVLPLGKDIGALVTSF